MMFDSKKTPKLRFDGFGEDWDKASLGNIAEFNPKSVLPEIFKYVDLESVIGTTLVSYRTENKKTAPSRAQRLAQFGDVFFQTVRPYQQNNLLYDLPFDQLIGFYTVADTADGVLKVMRSYQYFAAHAISDRVEKMRWGEKNKLGGYIWHTTGSPLLWIKRRQELILKSKRAVRFQHLPRIIGFSSCCRILCLQAVLI